MAKINCNMRLEWIPNVSLGMFVLKENIDKYLNLPHCAVPVDCGSYSYDSYYFPDQEVSMGVENQKIIFVSSSTSCFWKNKNLIGMPYEQFQEMIGNRQPDDEDICYVPILFKNRGQNQKVYDFDDLGLQIWVWRNKIRTVSISK